ncbi:MAG: FkbM family methyltransferase [Elusimicrobia bacterium]|nr:FkbM family methyltransferase [Elusimicrobiota bacterium]
MTLHRLAPNLKHALSAVQRLSSSRPARPPLTGAEDEVVLYGAGKLGELALNFLTAINVPVRYAIDRAAQKGMTLGHGISVRGLAHRPKKDHALILVTTASAPYTLIKKELNRLGWMRVLPFYDFALQFNQQHPLNNGWFAGPLTAEDKLGIRTVLASLADAHSRAAYLQFLAWRLLREDWIYDGAPVIPHERYFIKPVINSLTENEDFIDVGAYDGCVLFQLLQCVRNRLSSALMIEPDRRNVARLRNSLAKLHPAIRSKVTILPVALSNLTGEVHFSHGFGMASRLFESAKDLVKSIRLDDLDAPVSFIKLHVEGGEYDAILGGQKTLRRCQPIVTATAYHNRNGLWKTPLLLAQTLPEHTFYFRLHTWCGTGAVYYALPRHRSQARDYLPC